MAEAEADPELARHKILRPLSELWTAPLRAQRRRRCRRRLVGVEGLALGVSGLRCGVQHWTSADLSFVIPAIYYCTRYKLPRGLPTTLLALAGGIGFQGFLGWYMVASGLKEEIIENKEHPRVSQYRLAAHLSAALALYMGMFYTALTLRRDQKLAAQYKQGGAGAAAVDRLQTALSSPAVKKFRGLIGALTVMAFVTIVSGAFVAGLDAGLIYNEFPYMGEGFHPPLDELMDPRYAKKEDGSDKWWRNMLENPVTAQFDHRVMVSTPGPEGASMRLWWSPGAEERSSCSAA